MTASVPELTIRTISMPDIRQTSRAISTSISVGAPKLRPFFTASTTASSTAGWAWPRISGPQEPIRSI